MTQETHYQQYCVAKQNHPHLYARDLAKLLNISEAELLQARQGHDHVLRLADHQDNFMRRLLTALSAVGEVKVITRNEYAVHEQIGCYDNLQLAGHAGLVLNPRAIDLRLFLHQWRFAFAVTEQGPRGVRHSLQFFDQQGDAVHKIYATENTQLAQWQQVIQQFTAVTPSQSLAVNPYPTVSATTPSAVDPQFEQAWRQMTDIHQFFDLLKQYNLSRQQAFRAVSDDLAQQVSNQSLRQLLQDAQQTANEIMIFVANRGCVQIFTGAISKVVIKDNWINIFNRQFTLHLIEDAIAESWISCKPSDCGLLHSLELFAKDGTQIAQLFGQRSEGEPEQQQWQQQIAQLRTINHPHPANA